MVEPGTKINTSASFDMRPDRSQVVLIGLIVSAIISLLLGGVLVGMDKLIGLTFVAVSIALFICIVWCWRKSHRDTDLAQSHPTNLTLSENLSISTDSRLLSSAEGIRQFAKFVEAVSSINPLPEPSGLTGRGAIPIPNTESEASKLVNEINDNIQQFQNQAISHIQSTLSKGSIAQKISKDEAPSNATMDVSRHNMPMNITQPESGNT